MDKIERCAHAIHDSAVRNGASAGTWDDQPEIYRQRCHLYAAAAIAEWQRPRLWNRVRVQTADRLRVADRSISRAVTQSVAALRRARF